MFTNSLGNAFGSTTNVISTATSISAPVVAVILIVMITMVVVGFFVYRFLISSLKSTELTTGILHCRDGAKTISGKNLPELVNGREWSASFWMYLEASSHTNSDKHVVTFGSARENAPFMAVIDRSINRMYLIFRLSDAGSAIDNMSELTKFKSGAYSETGSHVIVPIEYVPLSRWVLITTVVDQDTVTTYFDNSIYSVVTSARFKMGGVIADPITDSVIIGSSNTGADAYVSKVRFYNYGLSVFHVDKVYNEGPGASGLLGYLGISKYRLQWPITTATSS